MSNQKLKIYTCICGRQFDHYQKFNGHKAHCKEHQFNKYGNLEVYNNRKLMHSQSAKTTLAIRREKRRIQLLQEWVNAKHTCEYCNIVMTEIYASGRFCSQKCARAYATYKQRDRINNQVSEKLRNNTNSKNSVRKCKTSNQVYKRGHLSTNVKKTTYHIIPHIINTTPVKMSNGDILNITKGYLHLYRSIHSVCEICGKQSSITFTGNTGRTVPNKLSVDHNHRTKKFRGLLCQNCNSRLGWYENHKDIIDDYLLRGQ